MGFLRHLASGKRIVLLKCYFARPRRLMSWKPYLFSFELGVCRPEQYRCHFDSEVVSINRQNALDQIAYAKQEGKDQHVGDLSCAFCLRDVIMEHFLYFCIRLPK